MKACLSLYQTHTSYTVFYGRRENAARASTPPCTTSIVYPGATTAPLAGAYSPLAGAQARRALRFLRHASPAGEVRA